MQTGKTKQDCSIDEAALFFVFLHESRKADH